MGKRGYSAPRKGTKQFWPRKRAKRIYPRVRTWTGDKGLLGHVGYKVGMTHVTVVDPRPKSITKGEEIAIPCTVLEIPEVKIAAVRLYGKLGYGSGVIKEVWAQNLDKTLSKTISMPKKLKSKIEDLKERLDESEEIRVIAYTLAKGTFLNKKKPEIFELGLGGSKEEQFAYASENLGKAVKISDVFKEGEFIDAHAVSKGKGFQGVIKRFGIRLQSHKAEKGRRKVGTLGPWTPKKTDWWIAQAGQMGYHARTDYNKKVLKIGNASDFKVNPAGGFVRTGGVRGEFIMLAGSVPGPKKRMIRLTHAVRLSRRKAAIPFEVSSVNLRSQQ
jgi:large subunit ribosomal protein L3